MATKAKTPSSKKKQTKKSTTTSRKKPSIGGKVGPITERMDAKAWGNYLMPKLKRKILIPLLK